MADGAVRPRAGRPNRRPRAALCPDHLHLAAMRSRAPCAICARPRPVLQQRRGQAAAAAAALAERAAFTPSTITSRNSPTASATTGNPAGHQLE
ncbi:MAG: hypothetical protein U0470_00990 [Anaerolineae bacterium]